MGDGSIAWLKGLRERQRVGWARNSFYLRSLACSRVLNIYETRSKNSKGGSDTQPFRVLSSYENPSRTNLFNWFQWAETDKSKGSPTAHGKGGLTCYPATTQPGCESGSIQERRTGKRNATINVTLVRKFCGLTVIWRYILIGIRCKSDWAEILRSSIHLHADCPKVSSW